MTDHSIQAIVNSSIYEIYIQEKEDEPIKCKKNGKTLWKYILIILVIIIIIIIIISVVLLIYRLCNKRKISNSIIEKINMELNDTLSSSLA